jgi:hypothetical protein
VYLSKFIAMAPSAYSERPGGADGTSSLGYVSEGAGSLIEIKTLTLGTRHRADPGTAIRRH